MKNILLSLVALCVATSAFAADPIFGPAKPPVKEGTGTFQAKSYGVEVKSVNDVKFVGIYDNKNGNGAVQKTLQSFSFQGLKFYTTATLSTNTVDGVSFLYSAIHKNKAHIIPTTLFELIEPLSSESKDFIPLYNELKNFFILKNLEQLGIVCIHNLSGLIFIRTIL
jgi:hypothetical protein